MRTIKRTADSGGDILIGRRGENRAACVIFDISKWVQIYGDGTAELLHCRKGDTAPYPCALERDGDTVTWTITSADTDVVGYGEAELRWYAGETLAKSAVYRTIVRRALEDGETADPPEPQQDWVTQMLADVDSRVEADVPLALAQAKASGEFDGEKGDKGDKGDTGPQGPQGPKGDTGERGEQGIQGETGAAGPQGPQGETGTTGATGPAGADGHTPVRGVDYWTEADRAEMVQDVLGALPIAEEAVF